MEYPDKEGASVFFAIEASSKGGHLFQLNYLNENKINATTSIVVNGEIWNNKLGLPFNDNWKLTSFKIPLEEGIKFY